MTYKILKYFSFCLIVIILSLTACKKDKISDKSIDYSYYPSEVGNWIEYDVTKINIDVYWDTLNYKVREVIESKYTDTTGGEVMRIERYIKRTDTTAWEIKDVWTAKLLTNALHKTEENVKFVKINFPAEIGKEWDGNAFNTLESEYYEITDMDVSEHIGNFDFDSVLTITQVNDSSKIHKDFAVEKFAKNIGLVYKYDLYIYSDLSMNPDLPIEERITRATIFKQVITNFGN